MKVRALKKPNLGQWRPPERQKHPYKREKLNPEKCSILRRGDADHIFFSDRVMCKRTLKPNGRWYDADRTMTLKLTKL